MILNDLPTHIILKVLHFLSTEDLQKLNQAITNQNNDLYLSHLIKISQQKAYQNIIKLLNKKFFFYDFIEKFAVYHLDPYSEELSKKPLFSNYDNNNCSILELDSNKNLGFGWHDLNQLKNSFLKTKQADQIQLVFNSVKLGNFLYQKRVKRELETSEQEQNPENSYYFICCKSEFDKSIYKKRDINSESNKNPFYLDNTLQKGKAPCEILAYKVFRSAHRDVTLRIKKAIFAGICGDNFVVISTINKHTRPGSMTKLIQAGMELAERC